MTFKSCTKHSEPLLNKLNILTAILTDSRPPKFEMLDINNCF